ncbi:MAG: aminotransferase class I/II-fold pyridoxal phosphate-dependent enzyme, partial [Promethearchaeota archaeon]
MYNKYFKPNLDLYVKNHDLDGYWELILGVLVYLRTPNLYAHIVENCKWYEIDDENDLDAAEYLFSSNKEQLRIISKQFGGHWRYNFIDFCFLFNLYFPTKELYRELSNELPSLIGNYPSTQDKIAKLISRWYKDETFKEYNLFVGNGASEFIRLINRHLINKITIPEPTFNEYEDLNPDQINQFILTEDSNFDLNVKDLIKSINNSNSNFALIINPNNPTARATLKEEIEILLKELPHLDGIIVDESFIDFTGNRKKYSCQSLVSKYPNLIIIRSLSKEFGIPGLRAGYLFTINEKVKKVIKKYLP